MNFHILSFQLNSRLYEYFTLNSKTSLPVSLEFCFRLLPIKIIIDAFPSSELRDYLAIDMTFQIVLLCTFSISTPLSSPSKTTAMLLLKRRCILFKETAFYKE